MEVSFFDFVDGELVNLVECGLIVCIYGFCKIVFGDMWWFSKFVWNIFDFLFGGVFVKFLLIGVVCFKDFFGVYNVKLCSNVIDNWFDFSL